MPQKNTTYTKKNTNLTLTVERLHKIFTNYKPRTSSRKYTKSVVGNLSKNEDPSHTRIWKKKNIKRNEYKTYYAYNKKGKQVNAQIF